jgi:hypothetical protein
LYRSNGVFLMIIWGLRSRNKVLGQVPYTCQQCRRNGFHTIVRSRRWFTLFFIPIFPFSKVSTSRCNLCGVQMRIPNDRAEAFFAPQPQVDAQQHPQTLPPVQAAPVNAQEQVQAPAANYPPQPSYYQADQTAQQ